MAKVDPETIAWRAGYRDAADLQTNAPGLVEHYPGKTAVPPINALVDDKGEK